MLKTLLQNLIKETHSITQRRGGYFVRMNTIFYFNHFKPDSFFVLCGCEEGRERVEIPLNQKFEIKENKLHVVDEYGDKMELTFFKLAQIPIDEMKTPEAIDNN